MTPLEKIAIVLIALAVVIIGAAIIYGRSLVRSDRERKELHRRRVEDEERERLFAKPTHGRIKSKNGLFDSHGERVELNPADFASYVRTPTTVRAMELDFEGELRDSRGVRRFTYGDYYCENEAGCHYITAAPYMRIAYRKMDNDTTKTLPAIEEGE